MFAVVTVDLAEWCSYDYNTDVRWNSVELSWLGSWNFSFIK